MKKWKTILALIFMGLAIVFNWGWFWGVLLLFGLIHYIVSKEIHFVEVVSLKENPVLYYIMLAIWSALTFYSIRAYFDF